MNEKDKRCSPNVVVGNKPRENGNGVVYTEMAIAKFLGWTQKHANMVESPNAMCRQAFDVLEAPQKTAHGDPVVPSLPRIPENKRTAAVGVWGLLTECWRFGDGGGKMVA